MPVKVQADLPVKEILESENIFVMDETRAVHQDIRPLKIMILNLMPLKEDTELQLLRSLSNTSLQVDVTFLMVASHEAKNTSTSHLNTFYVKFEDVRKNYYDGMIITGAPVEQMEFEEVDYWEVPIDDIRACKDVTILAESDEAGFYLGMAEEGRKIFVMGHPEYDRMTLDGEYHRDKDKGLPIEIPKNYYKNDDPNTKPVLLWRSHANNLYTNWLNYYVYQVTPYNLDGTPDFSGK